MLIPALKKVVSFILDSVYPPFCWNCGGSTDNSVGLCALCAEKISPIDKFCSRCGSVQQTESTPSCAYCSSKRLPYEFCRSLFRYDGVFRKLLTAHKYSSDTAATRILKHLINSLPLSLDFHPDVIVPVPQDRRRLRKRGYDHLVPFARLIASKLGNIPVLSLLRKKVATPPQASLSDSMRKKNLIGAFEVIPTPLPKKSKALLFDDVTSTGATLKECAKTLKKAGYIVGLLTLSR
ncbi:MAG: ComF family protein [Planctomycetota bacterium]|nr:ComF family protein [Planctomycetota bacterium]